MNDNVQAILSPVFNVCYVFGIKIVEFSVSERRLWLGSLYILLLWLVYYFLLWWSTLLHFINQPLHLLFFWLNNFIAILSIILGMCYDKKYRTCLKKLAIVDDTLEKMGTITNYQKLYIKMLLTVFGWFAYITYTIYLGVLWHRDRYSIMYSSFLTLLFDYSNHVNLFNDLIITSTLGYIELKFKQINKYLRKIEGNNEYVIKQAWEHSTLLLCQKGCPKFTSNKYTTWVVIHLHLELCKISSKLNSIFSLQMTVKMGAYFSFMALAFREIFNIIFITNYYHISNKVFYAFCNISFSLFNIFRLFVINYMCEKVKVQANATGDIINRIPYSTCDVATRENISQFLLQTSLKPLEFYGLGLFKFGLKFFHGFFSSLTTVIVILIQSHTQT